MLVKMSDLVGGRGGREFTSYLHTNGENIKAIYISAGDFIDSLQIVFENGMSQPDTLPKVGGEGGYRFEFFLDEDEQQYVLPLTYYFEELAHGERDNVDLIVSPANNATRVTNARLYDANESLHGDQAMKLKLYYTKLE